MKITLFNCFADPYRESMLIYARELKAALEKILKSGETLESFSPDFAILNPAPLRYLSQYVVYPAAAFFRQGNINHITDHSYAHLVHALDASKTVVTFHDAIWLRSRKSGAQAHNLSGLKKAAHIICDSEASRKALLEVLQYPEEKTTVVPLGLHECFKNQRQVSALPDLPEGPYILHVGHTQAYKNITALFEVLAILQSWGKKIKLLKIGTPFTPEQEKAARDKGVWPLIVHRGKVGQSQLPSVYRSAQVLLQPSVDEGFGFTVLEAMSMGLPVVASNRGSLPELMGAAGIRVEPEDHLAMAKSICGILENTELRAGMVREGQKRAANYTWENTAASVLEIYRSIAK